MNYGVSMGSEPGNHPKERGFTADECMCLDDGEGRGAERAPLSTAIRDTETLAHRPVASSGV